MSTTDHDLDRDPVWDVVDQAQPPEASPLFSRNVMREIRLLEAPTPWWKRFLASKPLIASSLAAAAAVAILIAVNPNDPASGITDGSTPDSATVAALHDELDQELLIAAAEDPSLFSDEQLLALLY